VLYSQHVGQAAVDTNHNNVTENVAGTNVYFFKYLKNTQNDWNHNINRSREIPLFILASRPQITMLSHCSPRSNRHNVRQRYLSVFSSLVACYGIWVHWMNSWDVRVRWTARLIFLTVLCQHDTPSHNNTPNLNSMWLQFHVLTVKQFVFIARSPVTTI